MAEQKKDAIWRALHPFEAFNNHDDKLGIRFTCNGKYHEFIIFNEKLEDLIARIRRQYPGAKNIEYQRYAWMGPPIALVWKKVK